MSMGHFPSIISQIITLSLETNNYLFLKKQKGDSCSTICKSAV